MAHTTVINYTERPLKGEIDLVDLIGALQEDLERAQRDADKAGDIEDVCYYDGEIEALTWVLRYLTVAPLAEQIETLEGSLRGLRALLDDTERDTPEFDRLHRRADEVSQEIHDLTNQKG